MTTKIKGLTERQAKNGDSYFVVTVEGEASPLYCWTPDTPASASATASASDELQIPEESIAASASAPCISTQFTDWLYGTRNETATQQAAALVEKSIKEIKSPVAWDQWSRVFEAVLTKALVDGRLAKGSYTMLCSPEGGSGYETTAEGICTAEEAAAGFVGGSPEPMTAARLAWYISNAVEYHLSAKPCSTSAQPIRYGKSAKAAIAAELTAKAAAKYGRELYSYAVELNADSVHSGVELCCQQGKLQAKCSETETWTASGWLRPITGYALQPIDNPEKP